MTAPTLCTPFLTELVSLSISDWAETRTLAKNPLIFFLLQHAFLQRFPTYSVSQIVKTKQTRTSLQKAGFCGIIGQSQVFHCRLTIAVFRWLRNLKVGKTRIIMQELAALASHSERWPSPLRGSNSAKQTDIFSLSNRGDFIADLPTKLDFLSAKPAKRPVRPRPPPLRDIMWWKVAFGEDTLSNLWLWSMSLVWCLHTWTCLKVCSG